MKFLALEHEKPASQASDFAPYLYEEARRAWKYYTAGVIRELYFNADEHTAVLILECADTDEARRILNSLPLVEAGLIDFDIIPLAAYTGFSRLSGSEDNQL